MERGFEIFGQRFGKTYGGVRSTGGLDENSSDLGVGCFSDDHGDSGLYDSGFFCGNLGEGGAEQGRMVERDVCDNADQRGDYVCGVEPASEAHFDYGDVDLLFGKPLECECGGQFEERRLWGYRILPICVDEIAYALFGNHLSVDAYPFSEVYQMGGSVECGFESGRLKYCGEGRCRGPFAVCAGDVYGSKFKLRVPEPVAEVLDGVESGLICRCSVSLEHRSLRKQPIDGLVVVHVYVYSE